MKSLNATRLWQIWNTEKCKFRRLSINISVQNAKKVGLGGAREEHRALVTADFAVSRHEKGFELQNISRRAFKES